MNNFFHNTDYIHLLVTNYTNDKDANNYLAVIKNNKKLVNKYKLKCYYNYSEIIKNPNKPYTCCHYDMWRPSHPYGCQIDIHKLPHSVTHLSLNDKFTEWIDNLPNQITHLTLNYGYDIFISHFPSNLIHLTLGCYFNHPINHLPESLQELTIGQKFKQRISHFPSQLQKLTLKNNFLLLPKLPHTLTHLTLTHASGYEIVNLPKHITHLVLENMHLSEYISKLIIQMTNQIHLLYLKINNCEYDKNQLLNIERYFDYKIVGQMQYKNIE